MYAIFLLVLHTDKQMSADVPNVITLHIVKGTAILT